MSCHLPCKNPQGKLVSLSCEKIESNMPEKQKIAINTIKYIPTKKLTHNILQKITKNCEKWKNTKNANKDIINYIDDYKINWKEATKCKDDDNLEKCASRFSTMNEFFQRERENIKIEQGKNILVSPADCRLVAFKTTNSATSFWIKGENFTVNKLLGKTELPVSKLFDNGSLIVCRLAPDDYHRFHFPIDSYYMGSYEITGQYYSVDPRIVNSKIDVFGDNKREVHMLYSPIFGNVFCVIIGATCTGSIEIEKLKEGSFYKKGTLLGKFGFGGSSIVMLFEKDTKLEICEIFLKNSEKSIETYVRVGTLLGKA